MARMSRRLVALQDMQYCQDETEALHVPAFLRKKVSEGKGKQRRT